MNDDEARRNLSTSNVRNKMSFYKSTKPLWRDIIDAHKYPSYIGYVQNFVPIAQSMGYNLFLWNEEVCEIVDGVAYFTGWSVKDLGRG